MVNLVLAWLALSVVSVLAYIFGASVGYRRGVGEARVQAMEAPSSAEAAAPGDLAVELRLPEDADRPR